MQSISIRIISFSSHIYLFNTLIKYPVKSSTIMKKIILYSTVILLLAACGAGNNNSDVAGMKAQLENLKKQQTLIKEKISMLEVQLAILDTSMKREEKLKYVGVTEMIPKNFNHFIEIQAMVEGDEDVSVNAELPGTITEVFVKPGDRVVAGQVLAVMDDGTLRENLASMKAQRDLAMSMFERQKNLWDQKIGSEVQFLQAKTNGFYETAAGNDENKIADQWNR